MVKQEKHIHSETFCEKKFYQRFYHYRRKIYLAVILDGESLIEKTNQKDKLSEIKLLRGTTVYNI